MQEPSEEHRTLDLMGTGTGRLSHSSAGLGVLTVKLMSYPPAVIGFTEPSSCPWVRDVAPAAQVYIEVVWEVRS